MVESSRANGTSIVDALAGKRVFLTGVTGFLGQVILERLLLDFPETTITVLVRSQTSATAVERVHYLTRKPAFDVLRQRLGGDDQLLALLDERVTVIDGDFTRGEPELPSGIDVAIHSAATVSFDPADRGRGVRAHPGLNTPKGRPGHV